MKIQILNKNIENNVAKRYEVDEAPVATEVKNETLDSATVIVSNQEDKIRVEPYDVVALIDEDGDTIKYMCVDTYAETLTCVNPKIYRYEISLFSETKQLEGIVLPNLKITKVWGETRSIYHYIKQYMDEYCPYIRIGTNASNYSFQPKWDYQWAGTNEHPNLFNKFSDECPEMQWNTPTLREVLNDLMMVKDCIPVLKDGRLDYMDLTETNNKNWENDNHINYVTRSKSSEDYVSELQVKLENVTNKSENVNNLVSRVEYCHLSIPDNEATLTNKNMILKTQYPIYNLKSVTLMFPGHGVVEYSGGSSTHVRKWMGADLMNLTDLNGGDNFSIVYEYQNWITKPILYNSTPPSNFSDWAKYQNYSLYYTRGSNEICNLGNTGKWTVIFTGTWTYYVELATKIMDYFSPVVPYGFDTYYYPKWYNLFFKIEYETLNGCLFRASKGDALEHEKIVIDNQTNSMVDSYAQGFLEYQKANRLGNEQLQINARFDNNEVPIKIGDMYEDCVIYQVQYQYFKNHTEVNALATKNYILREYFTGVKSKIRSWAIASGSEALTRHDLIKYYCEFSWNSHRERYGLTNLSENNIGLYFGSPFTSYTAKPLKTCFVRTTDDDGNDYPADLSYSNGTIRSYYCLDLSSRVVGNSLVFTFQFPDNYWAGQSFHTENDFNGNQPESGDKYIELSDLKVDGNNYGLDSSALCGGGVPMHQHRYTNDNGEFVGGEVIFADDINVIPKIFYTDPQINDNIYFSGDSSTKARDDTFIYQIYQRPRVLEWSFKNDGSVYQPAYSYQQLSAVFNFTKDSQEIFNLSVQFEFSSETNDICFSDQWMKRQKSVNAVNNSNSGYRLLIYSADKYNFRNPNELPKTTPVLSYTAKLEVRELENVNSNLNSVLVIVAYEERLKRSTSDDATQVGINISRNACLYLVDENDKPLLAFRNVPIDNIQAANITGTTNEWWPYYAINFNILRTRSKNIYNSDNHYLITGKI